MSRAKFNVRDCLDFLSSGYVRLKCKGLQHRIPVVLLNLISGFNENMFLKFSKSMVNEECMQVVNDTMIKLLKPNKDYGYGGSALIDLPIPVNKDSFSFSWKIRIRGKHFGNYHYFIGVASNNCQNFHCSAHGGLEESYGILGMTTGITVSGDSKNDLKYEHAFMSGDVVRVEYDGTSKKLIFSDFVTNKKMYIMDLPQDNERITHWYPAVSLRDLGDIAEIVW